MYILIQPSQWPHEILTVMAMLWIRKPFLKRLDDLPKVSGCEPGIQAFCYWSQPLNFMLYCYTGERKPSKNKWAYCFRIKGKMWVGGQDNVVTSIGMVVILL